MWTSLLFLVVILILHSHIMSDSVADKALCYRQTNTQTQTDKRADRQLNRTYVSCSVFLGCMVLERRLETEF